MSVKGCEKPNKELAKGNVMLDIPFDLKREVTKRQGTVVCQPTYCEKKFGLHLHRVIDELQTICNRHLMKTPVPDLTSVAWKSFTRRMRWLSRQIGRCSAASVAAILKGKTGRRRKRFLRGVEELRRQPITKKDARITEMQKLEMYEEDKLAIKEDRGIQFRSVKYNVALARELHNVERRLIGLHIDGYHPVMKGCTPQQRAERIAIAMKRFSKPRFLLLDHSRFDAHVNEHILAEEHKAFKRCRRRKATRAGKRRDVNSAVLSMLLAMQMSNYARSAGGIRYKTRGKRMSGDINTGLGNTWDNFCIIAAWLDASGVTKNCIFLDGDDSVVIIEQEDFEKLLPLDDFMRDIGMVTEMEWTDDFFKVEFCQSRPVLEGGRVTFVRNPQKVLATVGQSAERLDAPTAVANARASALCELAMNGNCAVIGPYCRRLLKDLGDGSVYFTPDQLWKAEQYACKFEAPDEREPDDLNRVSMYRAWGIDPGYQVALESQHIVYNDGMLAARTKKKKSNKPMLVDEFASEGDEWIGVHQDACDCGECPEYDSEEAFEAASRCL